MKGRKKDIDLTRETFYELFVNGPSDIRINNKPAWNCTCSCGNECNYTTYDLKSGKRKSCGHLRGKSRTLDLIGQTFHDLTVLYKVPNKGNSKSPKGNVVGRTYWHCLCSCGIECDAQTTDLTSGKRKDCGHSHKAYMHQTRTKNIVGEIHGYLEVLEMLPSKKINKKWRAMCRVRCLLCGNIVDVQKDYLISGDKQSCGCLKSVGEQTILEYLIKHNIPYKTQYHFDDLKTPKGGICWFDFGIFDDDKTLKCLIEYQGEQHYHEMPGPWNFGAYAREITDPLKQQYCDKNNIVLHQIRYDENIIEKLDRIFTC